VYQAKGALPRRIQGLTSSKHRCAFINSSPDRGFHCKLFNIVVTRHLPTWEPSRRTVDMHALGVAKHDVISGLVVGGNSRSPPKVVGGKVWYLLWSRPWHRPYVHRVESPTRVLPQGSWRIETSPSSMKELPVIDSRSKWVSEKETLLSKAAQMSCQVIL